MRYVVIVAYKVLPEKREAFFELVQQEAVALVENELNTLHVSSMVDAVEVNRFINLKIFENKDSFLEHQKGEILTAFLDLVDAMLLSGPEILFEGVHLFTKDDFSVEQNPIDPLVFLSMK